MPRSIFSIPIEGPAWPEIERSLRTREGSSAFWVVTANPEILLEATRDPAYAEVLREADLRTVDGMGLWLALRAQGETTTRLTGVELAEHVLAYAEEKEWKVALLGGKDPLRGREAIKQLQPRYPRLRLLAEQCGNITALGEMDEAGEEACLRLTIEEPQVLLVAFGHPRQERWIARHVHQFPSVNVVIGVGGTIDFWAGAVKRAPRWMRVLGLEWLWRLIQEPRRLKRIVRAVFLFPLVVCWDRIRPAQQKNK